MTAELVYRIWCEYDIGQEDVLFESRSGAIAFAKKALEAHGFDYDEILSDGLVGYDSVKVKKDEQ